MASLLHDAVRRWGIAPGAAELGQGASVGEREKAVEVLGKAMADHDLWLAHYLTAAPYDGLRKDPRAPALIATMSAR